MINVIVTVTTKENVLVAITVYNFSSMEDAQSAQKLLGKSIDPEDDENIYVDVLKSGSSIIHEFDGKHVEPNLLAE